MDVSFSEDKAHGVRLVSVTETGKVYAHTQNGYWEVRSIDGSRCFKTEAARMADKELPRGAWRWLMWLTHEQSA